MEKNSIGLIELSSIAAGIQAADILLKTSDVELIISRTICAGKYMALIAGDVAAVQTAVDRAVSENEYSVIDSFVIPNVDKRIFPAISGNSDIKQSGALGILESFSVASCIEAADAAVKTANVELIELRLAMAMGGKAFFTCTGDVSAVSAAIESGAKILEKKGLLVNKVVIANPRPELLSEIV